MKHLYFALAILVGLFVPVRYSAAQAANEFFHRAANFYISGNFPEAVRAVESGLQSDPANPKLLALRDKIKEEMEKQQQQSGSDQQNQQDQQKQDQQKNQQQNQQQQQDQQQKEKQQEQQQKAAQQKRDKEQLSKEDAARLLEALRNQEKEAQKQRQMKVQGRATVEKDW